ncbi:helix-turn-helix domain-containing protein [Dubosiella newyorkensis]|uniref:helix-turn-helix domain-containing protein n=2 Tax=Dubosiella newyorkensis TaxID=1862672 RepID=UPI00258B884E|nr:helix-turn-helix domain-containing protein [Dubosiella newyorkensis]
MHKGVKIALDPSPVQIVLLRKHAGTARFVYNHLLAYIQEEYEKGNKVSTNFYKLRKHWNSVKAEAAPWWNECSKEGNPEERSAIRDSSQKTDADRLLPIRPEALEP